MSMEAVCAQGRHDRAERLPRQQALAPSEVPAPASGRCAAALTSQRKKIQGVMKWSSARRGGLVMMSGSVVGRGGQKAGDGRAGQQAGTKPQAQQRAEGGQVGWRCTPVASGAIEATPSIALSPTHLPGLTRRVEAQRGGGRPVSHQVDPQQLHGDQALGQAQSRGQEDGRHLSQGCGRVQRCRRGWCSPKPRLLVRSMRIPHYHSRSRSRSLHPAAGAPTSPMLELIM